ncbi:Uncharacterised protein [Mycobacterium tuberculosis]|nr:Uncharacterised protein [Mycobacterium tuberculosis]
MLHNGGWYMSPYSAMVSASLRSVLALIILVCEKRRITKGLTTDTRTRESYSKHAREKE